MGRISIGLAVAGALALWAPHAGAQRPPEVETPGLNTPEQNRAICQDREAKYSDFEQIVSCMLAIDSGRFSGAELSNIYKDRSAAYIRAGRRDLAAADYNEGLKITPNDVWFLQARGQGYFDNADFDRAFVDFNKAVELDPVNGISRYFRGTIYLEWGNYAQARADFTEALKTGRDRQLLENRCTARMLGGWELEEALADCTEALALKPLFPGTALVARGMVHLRLGSLEAAAKDFDAAIALGEGSWLAGAAYGGGIVWVRAGEKAEGEKFIAAAKAADSALVERYVKAGIKP